MSYIIVGLAGVLGSMSRYSLSKLIGKCCKTGFPWATFLINISGALLLGAVTAYDFKHTAYLLAAEGFLGAFTTFSAFMYDGVCLLKSNKYNSAFVYITATMVLGVIGFGTGYVCIGALLR